ncbi:GntP family transporter [Corynebacterium kutscheri]|uniref:Inner membrane permease YgbN n=1 Tax=Corynebacterium kutscheri TaxID=35755 RepID=A0AB38VRK3_9CORY|nr:GntP family transporter [Corynebacterium kutscheri]VEH05740.1 inner membrane permease YgbN [Corynebacterium kutscheri]
MTGTALLGLGIGAVAVLLLLVIWLRVPAFVALIGVAIATAVVAGIPLADAVSTVTGGVGKTLGSVVVVVGLGAMLGRMIEVSGGAEAVAQYFTTKLGPKKVVAAVTLAAFVLGIPVFFDVGFIILAPIIFGFAAVAKINPLKIGLPVAGAMLTMHVALPPHPGPVAVAGTLEEDPGLMLTFGLPIAALTCVIGYFAAKLFKVDGIKRLASPVEINDSGPTGVAPSPFMIIGLILLPILMIMVGTTGAMLSEPGTSFHSAVSFIGSSPVALLTAVVVAWIFIGRQQKWNLDQGAGIMDSALPAVAVIIFVTGAGGGFANVLVESGIGQVLSDMLIGINMPLILMAFLLSLALRASQGSATVAMLTTTGLLVQPIADAGLNTVQVTLIMLSIGFGALGLSHINDSGFWIVTKYLGLSVKQGLKTWTVLSTIFGTAGFCLCWLLYALVG